MTSRLIIAIALVTLLFAQLESVLAQGIVGSHPVGWPDDRELAVCIETVKHNPSSIPAMHELADAYSARQEFAKAIPLRRRILDSIKSHNPADHEELANFYSELANDMRRDKHFEDAEKAFINGIDERQKAIQSKSSSHLKYCLELDFSNLGNCYADEGKLAEALSTYNKLTALQGQPNDSHHNLSELKKSCDD